MILRIDRHAAELPPPSDPDPKGAACVQELLGGKYGEMSTLMNYTFQSFNFRNRQGARPFYDLVANIAAEEFGHIELVSAAINTMLTDPSKATETAPAEVDDADFRNPQHFIAGGRAALPRTRTATPGTVITSMPPATWSRISPTTSSSRRGRATTSSRSTRWSTIRRPVRSPVTCSAAAASIRSPTPERSRSSPART